MRLWWLLSAIFFVLSQVSAQARARDDATAGAYRCAPIGELRQWLDCFYGSAQPVRAQLGLIPAPAAQIRLSTNPPTGNLPPAESQVRNDVMSAVLRCYAISADRQWLDCYYGAAQPVRARLGLSPGPQTPALNITEAPIQSAVPRNGPDLTSEDQFGMAATPRGMGRSVNHITSRMTSYSFSPFKIFTVALSNGQVWRQLSGDSNYAHWAKPAAAYMVTIGHGSFGSFNLQVKDIPGIFKVERVK